MMAKETEAQREKRLAKQYHSIVFRKKVNSSGTFDTTETNTWKTWRLIPSSRPEISMPTPVYKYVTIPGKSGDMDLSTYLTGKLIYGNRTGILEFYVIRDTSETGQKSWVARRNELSAYFDGSEFYMLLEDATHSYYRGRIMFKGWTTGPQISKVTLEYNLQPYRYKASLNKDGVTRQYYSEEIGL